MPTFCNPFDVMRADRKMTNEELVRAMRFNMAAEFESTQLYMQMAESTDNEMIKAALKEIADDERVHAGCFQRLLMALDPDEQSYYNSGAKEMEEKFINKSDAKYRNTVQDKPCDND